MPPDMVLGSPHQREEDAQSERALQKMAHSSGVACTRQNSNETRIGHPYAEPTHPGDFTIQCLLPPSVVYALCLRAEPWHASKSTYTYTQ